MTSAVKAEQTVEAEQAMVAGEAGEGRERVVIGSSALGAMAAPSRVLIAPWGQVRSANGEFVVDAESARLVMEAFAAQGTDVPIDYEHQSLGGVYASPTGQAPAAGWVRLLTAVEPGEADDVEPGLYADVEWTPAGREKLEAREYRYLSPVVMVRKRDRRVVALHSAALTNKPAIVGMKPIVNGEERGPVNAGGSGCGEEVVGVLGRENVGKCEGEKVRTGEGEKVGTCEGGEVTAGVEEAVEVLRMRLGLGQERDAATVLVAAAERLSSLTADSAEREAQERVEAAARAGKLTGAQREWALTLALRDAASFEAWAATAPVVVVTGRTAAPASGGGHGRRDRAAVIASARAGFQAEPALAMLTSEQAWIANALREAGVEQ